MKDIRMIAPKMANAGPPLEDVATAGQPEREDFRRLAEAGYRAVIDLRDPGEDRGFDEADTIRHARIAHVNIPVGHENVDEETFERFRKLMRDPERRPVFVHCSSANRVGALLFPYLVLDEGRFCEEALEIARQVGLRSDELEQAALRYAGCG